MHQGLFGDAVLLTVKKKKSETTSTLVSKDLAQCILTVVQPCMLLIIQNAVTTEAHPQVEASCSVKVSV